MHFSSCAITAANAITPSFLAATEFSRTDMDAAEAVAAETVAAEAVAAEVAMFWNAKFMKGGAC